MSVEKNPVRIAAAGDCGISFPTAGDCAFFLDCVETKLAFEQAKAAKLTPALRESTGTNAVLSRLHQWSTYAEQEYERLRKK